MLCATNSSPDNDALDAVCSKPKHENQVEVSISFIDRVVLSTAHFIFYCYHCVQSVSSNAFNFRCPYHWDGWKHRREIECAMTQKEMYELELTIQNLLRCKNPLKKTMEEIQALPFHSKSTQNSITKITHCQQSETWDCGVACIQMIMRWVAEDVEVHSSSTSHHNNCDANDFESRYGHSSPLSIDEKCRKKWMLKTLGTNSIWTIDLVVLLEKILAMRDKEKNSADFSTESAIHKGNDIDLTYLFCSRNLGVDELYEGFNYYKQSFRTDEDRVKKLFTLSRDGGLSTFRALYLDINFVLYLVSRENCVAIVLLDGNLLFNGGSDSKSKRVKLFSGHYVILCGISFDKEDIIQAETTGEEKGARYCMVLKNPGSTNATDFVTPLQFERAWRAKGTDHDIVFINAQSTT